MNTSSEPIIRNPLTTHPIWSGCKLVVVFLGPPMFLDMQPDFYYHTYLTFIVPILYCRELISLFLMIIGKGHLVDNTVPHINFVPYHNHSSGYQQLMDDDFIHHYDRSHRH